MIMCVKSLRGRRRSDINSRFTALPPRPELREALAQKMDQSSEATSV